MFDFFNNIIAFITSIGDVIISIVESTIGAIALLLASQEFMASIHFLPSPLTQAIMLSGSLAILFMVLGRNLGGGR